MFYREPFSGPTDGLPAGIEPQIPVRSLTVAPTTSMPTTTQQSAPSFRVATTTPTATLRQEPTGGTVGVRPGTVTPTPVAPTMVAPTSMPSITQPAVNPVSSAPPSTVRISVQPATRPVITPLPTTTPVLRQEPVGLPPQSQPPITREPAPSAGVPARVDPVAPNPGRPTTPITTPTVPGAPVMIRPEPKTGPDGGITQGPLPTANRNSVRGRALMVCARLPGLGCYGGLGLDAPMIDFSQAQPTGSGAVVDATSLLSRPQSVMSSQPGRSTVLARMNTSGDGGGASSGGGLPPLVASTSNYTTIAVVAVAAGLALLLLRR